MEDLLALFASITTYITPNTVDTLKLASTIISIALGFVFVIIFLKFRTLRRVTPSLAQEMNPPQAASGGAFRARWEEILRHMDSAREAEWKFAIIEADKLFDLVLQRAGFPGAGLGDRLMNMQEGQLPNMQNIWDAHKIRNQIAHSVDYFLRYSEAKRAIESYQDALRELGAI